MLMLLHFLHRLTKKTSIVQIKMWWSSVSLAYLSWVAVVLLEEGNIDFGLWCNVHPLDTLNKRNSHNQPRNTEH